MSKTKVITGSKSNIGTSAVSLTTINDDVVERGITIIADGNNTGTVYIGGDTVTANGSDTTTGVPLSAGDSIYIPINHISYLFVIATTTNNKVFFIGA